MWFNFPLLPQRRSNLTLVRTIFPEDNINDPSGKFTWVDLTLKYGICKNALDFISHALSHFYLKPLIGHV